MEGGAEVSEASCGISHQAHLLSSWPVCSPGSRQPPAPAAATDAAQVGHWQTPGECAAQTDKVSHAGTSSGIFCDWQQMHQHNAHTWWCLHTAMALNDTKHKPHCACRPAVPPCCVCLIVQLMQLCSSACWHSQVLCNSTAVHQRTAVLWPPTPILQGPKAT